MTDFAHTPFASEARVRKAARIEAALRMAGYTAQEARVLDAGTRRAVEKTAGVRRSSDETWGIVFRLLDSYRQPTPATSQTCPADGREQGDPALCHHCGSVITGHVTRDARAPAIRFCSEVCANAHLIGCP